MNKRLKYVDFPRKLCSSFHGQICPIFSTLYYIVTNFYGALEIGKLKLTYIIKLILPSYQSSPTITVDPIISVAWMTYYNGDDVLPVI